MTPPPPPTEKIPEDERVLVVWQQDVSAEQAEAFGLEAGPRESLLLLPIAEAAEWASKNDGVIFRLGETVGFMRDDAPAPVVDVEATEKTPAVETTEPPAAEAPAVEATSE
jgi:hypothetical protein